MAYDIGYYKYAYKCVSSFCGSNVNSAGSDIVTCWNDENCVDYVFQGANKFFSNTDILSENEGVLTRLDSDYSGYYFIGDCSKLVNGDTRYYCSSFGTKKCKAGNNYYNIGFSNIFYENSSVPFDQECKSETRTCGSNGIMNGDYTQRSCYVENIIKSDQTTSMGTALVQGGSGLLHIGIQILPYAIGFFILMLIFGLIKNWSRLKADRQLRKLHKNKTRKERAEIIGKTHYDYFSKGPTIYKD